MHLILCIGLPMLQSSVSNIPDAFMVIVFLFWYDYSALRTALSTQAVFVLFFFFNQLLFWFLGNVWCVSFTVVDWFGILPLDESPVPGHGAVVQKSK